MKGFNVAPKDSRYIPFTQQRLCCVPTTISMIMYRQSIQLIPIEELGYHLGLIVPPEDKHLFYNPRVAVTPPPVGYGTQIQEPEYDPNIVFAELGIPLKFELVPPRKIKDTDDLIAQLNAIVKKDEDAGLCFDWNTLHKKGGNKNCGHIVLFDRVINGKIRIIDPERNKPKWQLFEPEAMLSALRHHSQFSGGIWHFTRADT